MLFRPDPDGTAGRPGLGQADGQVAILLSTRNGAGFLPEQLASFLAQTHRDWTLFWRDDDSADGTPGIMRGFAAGPGAGRCVEVPGAGRLGLTGSFLHLLRHAREAAPGCVAYGFADQDDVWLPEKLARGLAALTGAEAGRPALYCARQMLVNERLERIGLSTPVRRAPGFPTALTQNVATGCTVMLNGSAAALVAGSAPPGPTLHDWWSYLLVAAAGGRLIVDDTPTVLYRQHPGNAVGAPLSWARRAMGALRRGPGVFMTVMRHHVAALRAHPHLLSPQAARDLAQIEAALNQGALHRAACLAMPGLRRQTWQETLLFRIWFLTG